MAYVSVIQDTLVIGVSVIILVQLLELSLNARKFFNSPADYTYSCSGNYPVAGK